MQLKKRMEFQTNRCDLFYTLSRRSYQWSSGTSSYNGECRSNGTAYACRSKGLERVVNALRVIAPELPFEIKFIEVTKPFEVLELNGYRISAFRVNHNVICYGYTIEILRQGKFFTGTCQRTGDSAEILESSSERPDDRGGWRGVYAGYGSRTGSKRY